MSKRDILHITVGDEANGWTPTQDDMAYIENIFKGAVIVEGEPQVIVTTAGVKVKVLSIEEGSDVRVVAAHVDQEMADTLSTEADPDLVPRFKPQK